MTRAVGCSCVAAVLVVCVVTFG